MPVVWRVERVVVLVRVPPGGILLAIVRKMGTMAGGFQLESFDSSDQLDRLGRPTRHGYTDPIHRTEKREIRAEKKAKRRERYPSIDTQLSGGDSP